MPMMGGNRRHLRTSFILSCCIFNQIQVEGLVQVISFHKGSTSSGLLVKDKSLSSPFHTSRVDIKASMDDILHNSAATTLAVVLLLTASLPMDASAYPMTDGAPSSSTVEVNAISQHDVPLSTNIISSTAIQTPQPMTMSQVFQKASKKALSGGKAGASAAVVQVCSLMWLRTAMNYQYRYGGNLRSSLKELYDEGGIQRLYQGLPFAIIQGPLTRFGDTAANVGILVLLESFAWSAGLPLPLRSACGSLTAGLWRIFLMPIDSSKTVMQVEGKGGLTRLWEDVRSNGPSPLYRGSLASAAATFAGHYPWFLTYNYFNEMLPVVDGADSIYSKDMALLLTLARSGLIGLMASCVSDVCSNSLRVIKTTKQTASLAGNGSNDGTTDVEEKELSYQQAVKIIVEEDGWIGLFGRGLQTRLLTNALQGALFSVLWKYFEKVLSQG